MATTKFASIDFEYYDTAEAKLNVVCASVRHDGETHSFWTHLDDAMSYTRCRTIREMLVNKINDLHAKGYTFLAYNVVAEASAFISLGLEPLKYRWVDLYLEYRCLSNHNDNYAYGKQLIKGRKKFTKKPLPKWQRKTESDEKKADASKQEYGMGAAVYKTLGIVIDSDFKKEIRDIIIACNSGRTQDIDKMVARKDEIMTYCDSDVEHLEPMFKEMLNEYSRLLGRRFNVETLRSDISNRADYACRTAIMERLGYPIRVKETRNFSDQVGNIIWECQSDINEQFKDKSEQIFRSTVQKRPLDLKWNQGFTRTLIQQWCKHNSYRGWIKTDGDDTSLSLKAFSKPISFNHSYPRGHFLAQMQRYLKLKQGLNGFTASTGKTKKKFWDSVGMDGRVRPYMGIYGAQSARSQPSATAFIPLKSAWMRSLIAPRQGRAICGIDFASQEFLLAALLSGDKEMLRAYESGDVYLSFGKSIGYIPQDGTKSEYKEKRDNCKAVVLGLSYDMSEYGLANDLTEKFGRKVEPEEALSWINQHKKAYKVFWKWKENFQKLYKQRKYVRLADGWMMWGDNDNFRSTGNVPVQGMGSCIMRKAVQLAQDRGLDVIYTLHDAIYIEHDSSTYNPSRLLAICMDEAFRFYFPDELKKVATVRLDADIWSPDYDDGAEYVENDYKTYYGVYSLPIKLQQTYIDERARDDYDRFSKYFHKMEFEEIIF